MHIVLGLIGILAAAGFWIYRINAAARGAQELADLAGTAANLPRKMRFQHKARKKGLAIVEDPREAALILMLGVARTAGEVSIEQKGVIRDQAMKHFQASEDEAEELLSRASWASSDLTNPDDAISRMVDLIAQKVNEEDRPGLIEMLRAVAIAEGEENVTPEQANFIARCRSRLGLR